MSANKFHERFLFSNKFPYDDVFHEGNSKENVKSSSNVTYVRNTLSFLIK